MFPPATWNEQEILQLIPNGQEEFLELDFKRADSLTKFARLSGADFGLRSRHAPGRTRVTLIWHSRDNHSGHKKEFFPRRPTTLPFSLGFKERDSGENPRMVRQIFRWPTSEPWGKAGLAQVNEC